MKKSNRQRVNSNYVEIVFFCNNNNNNNNNNFYFLELLSGKAPQNLLSFHKKQNKTKGGGLVLHKNLLSGRERCRRQITLKTRQIRQCIQILRW